MAEQKQLTVTEAMRSSLNRMEPEFAKALPSHISPRKFVRVAQTAITTTPALLKCTRQSLFAACTRAAEAGLLPNGKEAALVPFKEEAQFMPMIGGLLKLARNSGEIKTIDAQIVYKNDSFDYYIDTKGVHLTHRPNLFEERGQIVATYAIGETKDGGVYVEVMTNDQIKAIQNVSRGKNTPWNGPFRSEMIKKSVLRRLLKRLPTSTDLDFAAESDNVFYDMDTEPGEDNSTPTRPPKESEVVDENTGEIKDVSPAKETKKKDNPNNLEKMLADDKAEEQPPMPDDVIPI